MANVIVMYGMPDDPAAFDAYYEATHLPIAEAIPGLRGYSTSTGPVMTPTGLASVYRVATLRFDSLEAIAAAMASEEGQRATADLPNFATGGANVLMFDEHTV